MKLPNPSEILPAVYVRVSTIEQAKKGESLQVQEERCRARILSAGLQPVQVYCDDGYTAANEDRPAYQRMLRDLRDGRINQVVISKLDRISRSVRDFVNLCDEVEKLGGSVVSVSEDINTSTAAGRLQRHVLIAMAAFERERNAERVTEVMDARARRGLRNGGATPTGYRLASKGQLVPDPDAAPLVKEIFRLYLAGESSNQIAQTLRRRGNRIYRCRIIHILRNPIYAGRSRWRHEVFPAAHEPLVTWEEWQMVQKRMDVNAGDHGPRRRQKAYPYLLDGLVHCGICGRHMTTQYAKGRNSKYPYYRCVGEVRAGDCKMKPYNAEELDRFVTRKIIELCSDPQAIEEAVADQKIERKKGIKLLEEQLVIATKEASAADRRLENLMALATSGKITAENVGMMDRQLTELREIKERTADRRRVLEEEIAHQKTSATGKPLKEQLATVADHLTRGDASERRAWLRASVTRVTVTPESISIDSVFGTPVYPTDSDG